MTEPLDLESIFTDALAAARQGDAWADKCAAVIEYACNVELELEKTQTRLELLNGNDDTITGRARLSTLIEMADKLRAKHDESERLQEAHRNSVIAYGRLKTERDVALARAAELEAKDIAEAKCERLQNALHSALEYAEAYEAMPEARAAKLRALISKGATDGEQEELILNSASPTLKVGKPHPLPMVFRKAREGEVPGENIVITTYSATEWDALITARPDGSVVLEPAFFEAVKAASLTGSPRIELRKGDGETPDELQWRLQRYKDGEWQVVDQPITNWPPGFTAVKVGGWWVWHTTDLDPNEASTEQWKTPEEARGAAWKEHRRRGATDGE